MSFFDSKRKFLIAGIVIISIGGAIYTVDKVNPTLLESSVGFITTPIQKFASGTTLWFDRKIDYFRGINKLQAENQQLKDELLLARAETNRLQNVENENKELSSLMKMKSYFTTYETVGAKIIARNAGNWNNSFLIDKGTDDGMQKNMPVITADGLVGKIGECGKNYSKVITVMDDTDSVSAKITRTNDVGYVTGDAGLSSLCRIQSANEDKEILEGDEVITSNLSEIYPEGIMIGTVKTTNQKDDSENSYALLEPAVDIEHIENVLVLCKKTTDSVTQTSTTAQPTEAITESTTAAQTTTEAQTETQTEATEEYQNEYQDEEYQEEYQAETSDIPSKFLEPATQSEQ